MSYFIEETYENWNPKDAKKYYLRSGCSSSNLNRVLVKTLEVIINSDNFVALCRDKSKKLVTTLKDEVKGKKPETKTSNPPADKKISNREIITNHFNNIGEKPTLIINQVPVNELGIALIVVRKKTFINTLHIATANSSKRNNISNDTHFDVLALSSVGRPSSISATRPSPQVKWCLANGSNISNLFHSYREKPLKRIATNCGPDNIYEELSINGIMFITDEARLHYNIKSDEFEKSKEESFNKYTVNLESTKITEAIKKIVKVSKLDTDNAIDNAIMWCNEAIQSKSKMEKKVALSTSVMLV
ncbi:hypothetical protein HPULCUR_001315 [Helicostylum pulchrum]|uniref:Uncharacterized protein n=1 Tax=Helicostylum pulchrum TaxID=562976 RepID=A0ABP9XNY7_9FUNG